MNTASYQAYHSYLSEHVITPFYQVRLNNLNELHLNSVLKRKNPYLFKAKNIELAGDLVKSIVDAFLSSQEETIFGNLLEGFAIYVSKTLYRGIKSELKSVDLEFKRKGIYHIVSIKSGTSWGNSDQVNKMRDNFKLARTALKERGIRKEIVAVNGCIYGKDRVPFKTHTDPDKQYFKYAGQDFWNFISQDDQLYREIIVPIDQEARQKDEAFKKAYAAKVNEMTQQFTNSFMTADNQIDWLKLIDFVSQREDGKPTRSTPKARARIPTS
ncbi:MAG: PmeII family type II restriction endonuclease [Blastocatellia bacterium]